MSATQFAYLIVGIPLHKVYREEENHTQVTKYNEDTGEPYIANIVEKTKFLGNLNVTEYCEAWSSTVITRKINPIIAPLKLIGNEYIGLVIGNTSYSYIEIPSNFEHKVNIVNSRLEELGIANKASLLLCSVKEFDF